MGKSVLMVDLVGAHLDTEVNNNLEWGQRRE